MALQAFRDMRMCRWKTELSNAATSLLLAASTESTLKGRVEIFPMVERCGAAAQQQRGKRYARQRSRQAIHGASGFASRGPAGTTLAPTARASPTTAERLPSVVTTTTCTPKRATMVW